MPITHRWNGTVLTITSDSGTSSADLKGQKGDDGARGVQGATGTVIVNGCDLTEYATREYVDNMVNGGVSLDNYYTKTETDTAIGNALADVELSNYYTKAETETAIRGVAFYVDEKIEAIPETDLSNYYTKTQTNALVNNAPYIDELELAERCYTKKETDNLLTPYADKATVNSMFSNYYTKTETTNAIKTALTPYALKTDIADMATKTATEATYAKKKDIPSLTGYATETYVNTAIAGIQGDNIAEYVKAEAERVADNILSVRTANSFVLAGASDLHTSGDDTSAIGVLHAGQAMNAINDLTNIDLVALFGDIIVDRFDDTYKEGFKFVKKSFSEIYKAVPHIQLQGNHDELNTDTTEEAQQKYWAYIGANNVNVITDYENKYRNYGYRDFDNYKIRVIYANTADVSELDITTDTHMTAEQCQWLANVAFDLSGKEDWGVIVLSHHPLNYGAGSSYLLPLLNAFKGKESGTLSNGVSYNFTAGTAEFICHLHGHIHNYRVETFGTNKVLSMTVPNACYGRNNEYGTHSAYNEYTHNILGDPIDSTQPWSVDNQYQHNKVSNTAEDTAFCVFVIDRDSKKIYAYHYGAGRSRYWNYETGVKFAEDESGEPIEPETPTEPTTYTNLVPTATDETGAIFNGKGYIEGKRWGSSSEGFSTYKDEAGYMLIGMMPYTLGQTIRIKGASTNSSTWSSSMFKFFKSDRSNVAGGYLSFHDASNTKYPTEFTVDGDIIVFAPTTTCSYLTAESAYVAIVVKPTNGVENVVITVDEEIN